MINGNQYLLVQETCPSMVILDIKVQSTIGLTQYQTERLNSGYSDISRGEHVQLFLSPLSQFRNLKEAHPQSQFRNFLKKCCFTTATPQFCNRNFFWCLQLQAHYLRASFRQFSAYFWPWNPVGVHEKIRGKKSCATVPLRQVFGFQRNRQF